MTKATLTPKQAAFIDEFACDMNATQAAIRAGYSAKTAKEQATRLLSNVHVSAAIAEKRADRSERTGITADRVLQELARVAFFDIRKLLNDDGAMKPLSELDDDTAAAIAGIDLTELRDGEGTPVGMLKKIKIADKLVALDKLARNLGLLQDKLKLVNDPENPLLILIQRINSRGSSIRPVIQGVVEDYERAA
jgi:phage terminase small subunit